MLTIWLFFVPKRPTYIPFIAYPRGKALFALGLYPNPRGKALFGLPLYPYPRGKVLFALPLYPNP